MGARSFLFFGELFFSPEFVSRCKPVFFAYVSWFLRVPLSLQTRTWFMHSNALLFSLFCRARVLKGFVRFFSLPVGEDNKNDKKRKRRRKCVIDGIRTRKENWTLIFAHFGVSNWKLIFVRVNGHMINTDFRAFDPREQFLRFSSLQDRIYMYVPPYMCEYARECWSSRPSSPL